MSGATVPIYLHDAGYGKQRGEPNGSWGRGGSLNCTIIGPLQSRAEKYKSKF
jgi:hypothetical protein